MTITHFFPLKFMFKVLGTNWWNCLYNVQGLEYNKTGGIVWM